MNSPQDTDDVLDLVSSSQLELERVPGCDSEKTDIRFDSTEIEPPTRQARSVRRELLQNEFPAEI